jgi:FHA domain
MAMVQCQDGHLYDDRKHTHCPHCPVPGLRDVTIPGTQAAPMSRPGIPETEAAPRSRGAAPPIRGSAVRGGGNADRGGGASGVTVGIFQKHTGMDPVVGWLVCIRGANKGRDYRLHSDLNKLGRAPNMDVCIEGDEAISRENHCQIAFSPRSKTFNIIPGDGRNLSYLNDQDVLSAMRLKAYDRIDLGDSSFIFIPFEFDWETSTQRDSTTDQPPPITAPDEPPRRPDGRNETKVP